MTPTPIDFRIWWPRRKSRYEVILIWGSPEACAALRDSVELVTRGPGRPKSFSLAEPTGADLEFHQCGIRRFAKTLVIRRSEKNAIDLELVLDEVGRSVEFVLSPGLAEDQLVRVLNDMASGNGDTSFACVSKGKKAYVRY